MRIILFDIETSPILGYVWGMHEQDVVGVVEHSFLLCFSYKVLGERGVHSCSLPDFPLYKKEPHNDRELVKALWKVLDDADVVIAHNGDKFDIKKANTFFAKNGLTPPSPYQTIDTLKQAYRVFRFDSSKLDSVGEYLDLGRKVGTGGFGLWTGCLNGDKKSWYKMVKYCKQDVQLLEKAYLRIRPWITNHPNVGLYEDRPACPNCGHNKLQRRGYRYTRVSKFIRYQCFGCGAWCSAERESGKVVYR